MHICKPERNALQTKLLLTVCTLVTATLFLISVFEIPYASLINLCGYISLVISILLCVRFSMTEYEYAIGGGNFTIIKQLGSKRQIVCNVALETAIALIEKRDYDHLPSNEKAIIKYSLNQNIRANSYVFLCEFNGKRAMIEFEPNPQFVSLMKDEISRIKRDASDETAFS